VEEDILHLRAGVKPGIRCDAVASIDTIEIFFPLTLTRDQHLALRRYGPFSSNAKGQLWGHQLIINRPSRAALLELDRPTHELRGVLSRLDIAVEIQPANADSVEELQSWIIRSTILKWRRRGPMGDFDDGTYWQMRRRSGRRSTRNLLVYADEVNRVTGEPNCVHLELRFLRAATIRRQGIRRIKDLINLNPSKSFARHVKFSDAGELGEMLVIKAMRQAVREDIEKYRGRETSRFTDQYRSAIPRRVRGLWHRLGYDRRAQYVKDIGAQRKINGIEPPFSIPHELSWSNQVLPIIGLLKTKRNLKRSGELEC